MTLLPRKPSLRAISRFHNCGSKATSSRGLSPKESCRNHSSLPPYQSNLELDFTESFPRFLYHLSYATIKANPFLLHKPLIATMTTATVAASRMEHQRPQKMPSTLRLGFGAFREEELSFFFGGDISSDNSGNSSGELRNHLPFCDKPQPEHTKCMLVCDPEVICRMRILKNQGIWMSVLLGNPFRDDIKKGFLQTLGLEDEDCLTVYSLSHKPGKFVGVFSNPVVRGIALSTHHVLNPMRNMRNLCSYPSCAH